MAKLTELINIGPIIAKKLEKIGIKTAEEFLAHDPYQVFEELLIKVDPTLCRCALASLVGAQQGLPWHKVTKQSAQHFAAMHPQHRWENC